MLCFHFMLSAVCFLLSAFCFLLSAFCFLLSAVHLGIQSFAIRPDTSSLCSICIREQKQELAHQRTSCLSCANTPPSRYTCFLTMGVICYLLYVFNAMQRQTAHSTHTDLQESSRRKLVCFACTNLHVLAKLMQFAVYALVPGQKNTASRKYTPSSHCNCVYKQVCL